MNGSLPVTAEAHQKSPRRGSTSSLAASTSSDTFARRESGRNSKHRSNSVSFSLDDNRVEEIKSWKSMSHRAVRRTWYSESEILDMKIFTRNLSRVISQTADHSEAIDEVEETVRGIVCSERVRKKRDKIKEASRKAVLGKQQLKSDKLSQSSRAKTQHKGASTTTATTTSNTTIPRLSPEQPINTAQQKAISDAYRSASKDSVIEARLIAIKDQAEVQAELDLIRKDYPPTKKPPSNNAGMQTLRLKLTKWTW